MPTTEIGIEVQTISVDRKLRRNRKMIRITSTEPIITCSCTAPIDRSMNLALSSSSDSLMPGTSRLIRSISARTPCGDLHRVRARLLGDLHADARPAVDAEHGAVVFRRVDDFGDVLQVDRNAVLRQDDQVPDLIEVLELSLAAKQKSAVAPINLADRDVLVLRPEHVDDAVDRQIERRDLLA